MTQPNKIFFPQGLPGFERLKYFIVSKVPETPFYYLESVEESEICFLLLNPFDFITNYEFEIPELIQEILEIESLSDIAVFDIINASQGLNKATINLQAPLVINVKKSKGYQIVLNNPSLNIRQPLEFFLQGTVGK